MSTVLEQLAAGVIICCGDAYHLVCPNLFGDVEIFDRRTDTARPFTEADSKNCYCLN